MTKVVFNRTVPMIDRDSFLTPFDKMFDQIVSAQFPEMTKTVGVNPMQGTAYPKVNVYEYDDKVGVVAEIPGLDKKDLTIDVEDGVLTIAGDKHGLFDDQGAKVFQTREETAVEFRERLFSKSLFGALAYYNSLSSASRLAPSVETFQRDLTNQVRRMVEDRYPHWRKAFEFSEPWIEANLVWS